MAELAIGDRDEALDVVQDVMIAFVRRYGARPEAQWKPLFYRCVENRTRDWFRRRSTLGRWIDRFFSPHGDGDNPTFQQPLPCPERDVDIGGFGAALESALAELPHRQRQTVLLRLWQGLSVEETARALGVSGGSVKTHLSRATHRLRELLQDYQP